MVKYNKQRGDCSGGLRELQGEALEEVRKAPVAAGHPYMLLSIKSQFSFSTMGFPQVTNQQAAHETHKVFFVTVENIKLYKH